MISPSFHPRFVRRGSSEDGRLRCPRPMGANFPFAHSSHPRILSPIGSHGECQVGGGEPQDGGKLGFPLPFLLPLLTRKISGMKIDFVPTGPRLTLLSAPLWIKKPLFSKPLLHHSDRFRPVGDFLISTRWNTRSTSGCKISTYTTTLLNNGKECTARRAT